MSILETFVIGMTFGAIVGGMSVQWANDRVELNRLKAPRTRAKKVTKQVKHRQLEYKPEAR